MARQRTTWMFRHRYRNGLLRAGFVHNLNPKNAKIRDVVRLQWQKHGKVDIDLYMRPEEALSAVMGLAWVVGEKWVGQQESDEQKREVAEGKRNRRTGEVV